MAIKQLSYVPYLTLQDYLTTIQSGQLSQQILDPIRAGGMELMNAESWAISEVLGYIGQQYDVFFEITETKPYSNTKKYFAGSRVILDFPVWIPGSGNSEGDTSYSVGDCVINPISSTINGAYICTNQNSDSVFNILNWKQLGCQYDIFFIDFPYPIFRQEIQPQKGAFTDGVYNSGSGNLPQSKVWWNNHTYSCLNSTVVPVDQQIIQYRNINDIPKPNIFPNDPVNGSSYWQDNGEFSFRGIYPFKYDNANPDGNIPSEGIPDDYDPSVPVWTYGDNRDPIIVQILISLSLWKLHSRISPNNIPDLRERNKNSSFEWLREIKKGNRNISIEPLQPLQGDDFLCGSAPKYNNRY